MKPALLKCIHDFHGLHISTIVRTIRCANPALIGVSGDNKAGRPSQGRGAVLVSERSMFSPAHAHESTLGSAETTRELMAACGSHQRGLQESMVGGLSSVPLQLMAGGRRVAWDAGEPSAGTGDGLAKFSFASGTPVKMSPARFEAAVPVQIVFGRQCFVVPDLGRRVRDRGPPFGADNRRCCHNSVWRSHYDCETKTETGPDRVRPHGGTIPEPSNSSGSCPRPDDVWRLGVQRWYTNAATSASRTR